MNKELMIMAGVFLLVILLAVFDGSGAPGVTGVSQGSSSPVNYSRQSDQRSSQAAVASSSKSEKSCNYNGIELKGKVQFVDSFPDLKIEYVSSFSDIDVQFVSSFPDDCGEWQEVSSFPDFKVQVVTSFPDIKVKKVSSFPGMN
ncbi:hypothetical protein [Marinicella rhabdoformis]|uniref:hypothetical protein n=1 Tax=Marinicella rhabdoformis TaxID=2580566 RepID=UPI001C551FDF|nr:hypothetical protein [Marinicella rhabdoformis]